jgi:hypothetical protein
MTTKVQTFPLMDGAATLILPRRAERWRLSALRFTVINDAAGPPSVIPILTIRHAGVCEKVRLAGQPVGTGLTVTQSFGRHLDDGVDTLTAVSYVARRSLPDLLLDPSDTVELRTAEGDGTTTIDDITTVTEE